MHVRCLEASHHRTSSEYHTNLYLCLNVILDSVLYAITDGDLSNIHTVDEAVEKMGFGAFQILLSMFAGAIWVSMFFYTFQFIFPTCVLLAG